MIFFVAMPFVIGLMNFAVPLQLGVRDVAFPTLNSVGFWLTAAGHSWSTSPSWWGVCPHRVAAVPPLSELTYSPESASTITSGRSRYPASAR